jgi:hypothetical protein
MSIARLTSSRMTYALAGALLTAAPALAQTQQGSGDAKAPAQAAKELVRYLRAGEQGAKAYNLPDPQAVVVLDVAPGGVLAVHGERNGWLDVEAPGGFKVWVFGEFLAVGDEPGTVRVQGNDVRMRPRPSSDVDSYALAQKLGRNQKLTVIARRDETLPLASDWVQVWSPAGARAWVNASDTVALEAGASGTALWAAASKEALEARKPADVVDAASPKAAEAGAPAAEAAGASKAAPQDAKAALERADKLFLAEKSKEASNGAPDYAAVTAAYQEVLDMAPKASVSELAAARLSEVKLQEEAYLLRRDIEFERSRRQAEADAARERMKDAGNRDPYYGKFVTRGFVERRAVPGAKDPIWMLRWSGADAAELVCFYSRYDLSIFEGFEVGVDGSVLAQGQEASSSSPARAQRIDVKRIEVLSGSAAGNKR